MKTQERQLSGLRGFAWQVEQFLARMKAGATAPRESRGTPVLEKGDASESLGYVPGASASSSATSSARLQIPKPPTIPAPPIPKDGSPRSGETAPSSRPSKGSTTHFSTVRSKVRSGAIRIEITDPEQWSAGDVAVIRNQEAKKVRDIGSLIFETPIQHDYEAGVEVRSLLSTEELEEIDGRLAVLDVNPSTDTRFVRFWVDEISLECHCQRSSRRKAFKCRTCHVSTLDVSHIAGTEQRRALTSEEEWITMGMKLHKGNEFPWVEVRMKEGNAFPMTKEQLHLE